MNFLCNIKFLYFFHKNEKPTMLKMFFNIKKNIAKATFFNHYNILLIEFPYFRYAGIF